MHCGILNGAVSFKKLFVMYKYNPPNATIVANQCMSDWEWEKMKKNEKTQIFC